ncbi:dynamin-related protein 3A-like isoform X1 [Iris pallida]|uniref:Dynamin-related protein 3A-like isoform X1 n=1 Tax=Iris pallida TaxID=29817 RepID=A0AAX6HMY4_IRIPA|nr:dynamin-related protein 3A-like isoform X1 [Iris pallida]
MAEGSSAAGPVGHTVIPIVNKLQDIFAQLGSSSTVDLPQVAVIGSQSSGKSSVLEALVGRDFLPRGNDICTRRPLVLQLVHHARAGAAGGGGGGGEAVAGGDEWGEFLHLPGRRFFDFSEIRREIQAETDREAGGNKGVSDKQIRLKIFSPNVLNITLVDLPGITKVPVGDQPTDIEARIRTTILSYIKHETCIILAVSPANADLTNSDALQMARIADPDGSRTIGVITKLDIMDKGTDARNFLLGNVIPLRLGYVGVVNRSQHDINENRAIKDALAFEESFFRRNPVYNGLSHCCGIPQLAKKLNQILVQHIKAVLPGLKSRINAQLVAVAKEHATFGDVPESKVGQGVQILNILAKYCEAFSSMVEGKNEELSTTELSGGARIHYIFQSIFVKSLEEVDPFDDVTDEDIRMAIQNATGTRSSLFVPEVPFENLVRRQISRLLDPSLQCAKFIYDELMKMSHRCLSNELQRFPVLRKCMDEVIGKFLRDSLQPAESMITHIIEMEADYINTSHPNFIGGHKAMEIAQQHVKSSRLAASVSRSKDGVDSDKLQASEKGQKSRAILARSGANGIISDQVNRPVADSEKPSSAGSATGSSWGISSIFGSVENRAPPKETSVNKSYTVPVQNIEHSLSMIQLKEPPMVLRPSENQTEQEALEIAITKLLLKSYYDIVRKIIEDSVPKAIMHFLVNQAKRELHNVFIRKLYRESLFEDMLREPDDTAVKRKRIQETLRVLEQAYRTLDELPLEAESIEKGYSLDTDLTGLPKINGLPSAYYASSSEYGSPYTSSPKNPRTRKSSHSGEQPSLFYQNSDSNGFISYPTVDG